MKNNKFFQKLAENWKVKVFCVLCAFGIYLLCQVSLLEKRNFAVPLSVKNEGNLSYTESLPRYVRISVKGEAAEIGLLQDDDFSTYLDLSVYAEEGSYVIPVQLDLSNKAAAIDKLQIVIDPEYVKLKLEPNITSLIPVKINISGECASGYEITETTISPNSVEVTGPASLVKGTKYIETNAVNVSEKSYNFSKSVNPINQNMRLKLTGNKNFKVNVNIKPIVVKKEFNSENISFKNLLENLAVKNDLLTYSMIVSGTENDLEKFSPVPETVYVDCADISQPGIYELPLGVNLPNGFKLDKISPEKISVEVIDREDLEKEITDKSEDLVLSGESEIEQNDTDLSVEEKNSDDVTAEKESEDKTSGDEKSEPDEKNDKSEEEKKPKKKGFFSRG